jgi:hypothetical protein
VSPAAVTRFVEIFDGAELHFSPETFDDLMLLGREFRSNNLIMRLIPEQDFPRCEEKVHEV